MATKPDDEDETLELTEDQQIDTPDDEQRADDAGEGDQPADPNVNDEEDEEATIVSFGDPEEDQDGDSSTIRQLRKELREAKQRQRELDKGPTAKRTRRPEPTSEDHGYDDEAFKADYKAWLKEEAEADAEETRETERHTAIQRAWEADVAAFNEKKAKLGFADVDDAADIVAASLDLAQQAVIVKAATDPALFMYALAKSPAKLAALAGQKDVIKLAAEIARMEGGIKVTKKRKGPNIDTPQRGAGRTPQKGDVQKQLDKLEKEAAASGDRTKLINYKRQHNLK
jgi:hypothetical protein